MRPPLDWRNLSSVDSANADQSLCSILPDVPDPSEYQPVAERPIISRLVSLERLVEIKTGMVFALETYSPATEGYSAARIEEEVVVTDTGPQGDFAFSR